MAESWIVEETRTLDLNDARLNARLREVLAQLGEHPTASIPAACGGHAEMTAAYRLFDNKNATFERILAPHTAVTRRRMAAQPTVVLAQDTTEIDVTRPTQQVQGAGPLDKGTRRGLLLHELHAFTPDGTPLGTVASAPWARAEGAVCVPLSRAQRAAIPIENKESYRWVQTLRTARAEAVHCPTTRIICVCDSEADIYEVLTEAQADPHRIDWIVRGCQDRALQRKADDTSAGHIYERVLEQAVLFSQTIRVRGRESKIACETRGRRQPRRSRQAHVQVRSARVTLRPPWRPDGELPAIAVNVVLVREVDAPGDDEPIEWLLLTNLPVDHAAQVREVIQYYGVRWMIEVFFRVLKSGCRVEARRFEQLDRLQTCLAVYLIIAWRTLYVCRLGRACPDIDCEAIFESSEWKSVWKIVRRSDPPAQPPTLGDMTLMVAQLGGYVHRKGSHPGPQTIWIGLQRTHDFALCWKHFGPDATVCSPDV
jgi:hypothetical protein